MEECQTSCRSRFDLLDSLGLFFFFFYNEFKFRALDMFLKLPRKYMDFVSDFLLNSLIWQSSIDSHRRCDIWPLWISQ